MGANADSTETDTATAAGRPKRVFFETYGCQMNVADTQMMAGMLDERGYKQAECADDADVILVNTCAVRERAEERVLARVASLRQHKRERPHVVLGVTGCMAEHLKARLLERAPEVDLVVGPDAYRRLPDLLRRASGGAAVVDVQLDKDETYEGVAASKVDGVNGWISIQRGCDKFCTFCIVPFVRGRERSAAPREVLRQARALVAQGAVELTLLGQTVNSYRYEDVDFADLLVAVADVPGVRRVRFTSPYPLDFSAKLIEVMARRAEVMPHVHLPVQSGDDEVLARMRRGHTVAEYLALVDALRAAIPNISLTTDIIVGFPAESEAAFDQTLALVERVRFDSAFMFLYSERSQTYARRHLPDDVPLEVKKARLTRLIECQERISGEVNATMVGSVVPVLVTGRSRRSAAHWTGKTDTFKSTVFAKPAARSAIGPGSVVPVRIERSTSHTLLGALAKG